MVSGEALRRQIAQWISGRNCALLGGDVRDTGGLTVSGLAGDRVVDDLRQGITSLAAGDQVDWRVSGVNPIAARRWTHCVRWFRLLLRPAVPG